MAILSTLKGVAAEVTINGTPCREHDDNEDDEASHNALITSKFIEAKSGAHFAVSRRFTEEYPHKSNPVRLEVFVDGECMDVTILTPETLKKRSGHTWEVSGHEYSGPEGPLRRPFKFSELAIDENGETDNLQPKQVAQLGEIKLKIWRQKVGRHVLDNSLWKEKSAKTFDSFPEKALKGQALSHVASLGDAVSVAKRRTYSCDYLDPPETPFVIFKFKYRSLDALKALCVIPRSPTPEPLEDRAVESLSADELRELVRIQKERLKGGRVKKEMKREHNLDDGDELQTISSRPCKAPRLSSQRNNENMEIVDLTSD